MAPLHGEQARPPTPPMQVAARALLAAFDTLVANLAAAAQAEIPAYDDLLTAPPHTDFAVHALAPIELFLRTEVSGRPVTEEDLVAALHWGAERARDGVPLEAVLTTYALGAREAWKLATALPVELPDEFVERILDFLGRAMPRAVAAYLHVYEEVDFERREYREALASALLSGRAVDRASSRFDRSLAEHYTVIVFDLSAGTTGSPDAAEALRRLRDELSELPDVLAGFRDNDSVLLVPTSDPGETEHRIADLMGLLQQAGGGHTVAVSSGPTPRADLPAAHDRVLELRHLAVQLGRPPGLYTLDDLALDFQIAQPGPARTALAARLAPVARHLHLLDALRALVAHADNRTEAARALMIHRNTLVYRLGRIHDLTGLDPADPADARTLAAALTAHDLTSWGSAANGR